MKLLPLRPRRSASPPPRSASPPQKICFAPVVPLRPRRNSALPQKFTPTSRPVSGSYVYKYWREISLTAVLINASTYKHDFRVDCELCRHWGLSRRTGAKQNCAGGVEERRGRSRFFAGAKQNGAGAKQNGGGEEEGEKPVEHGTGGREKACRARSHVPPSMFERDNADEWII
ncbi:hypothetical protein Bbelb_216230 [Branchiostoma belcheri]|nr:hypothetical protein Bbelb_216230 [Branchiostoma belcheri]